MKLFEIDIGDHLALRTWNIESAPLLFSLVDRNREHLGRWLPWVPFVRSVEDSEKFIRDAVQKWENQEGLELGIWDGVDLVGCIGLHELNRLHNKTSIGYWLGAEYQGRGIMTNAVQAFVQYCFQEQKFHRVEIRAAVENIASRAVAERAGFLQEGVLRAAEFVQEKYLDIVVYSKINDVES
jgi:ribosomal-protein-serine acetyltransferase